MNVSTSPSEASNAMNRTGRTRISNCPSWAWWLLLILSAAAGIASTHAADVLVMNANNDGPGSLRQAIADVPQGGTIGFDPSLNGQTIVLSGEPLFIEKSMTIEGPGASQLTVNGDDKLQCFVVLSGTVFFRGLTLSQGDDSSFYIYRGGGLSVQDSATVYVIECVVEKSASASVAGNIHNQGVLYLVSSTVANSAPSVCGGISNSGTGRLEIYNSTITGNFSPLGITSGVYNEGILKLVHSTVAFNLGGTLIRGLQAAGHETLHNSIIIGHRGGDVGGEVEEARNCLIGNPEALEGIQHGELGNIVGDQGQGPLDPSTVLARDLANLGGPTPVLGLIPGSPAIDAGLNTLANDFNGEPLQFDQRGPGFSRLEDGNHDFALYVDMGAFEFRNTLPNVVCPVQGTVVDCASPQGEPVVVQVRVRDPDEGQVLTVGLYGLNDQLLSSQSVATPVSNQLVSFDPVLFSEGTHDLEVRVHDTLETVFCRTSVQVIADQEPPAISVPENILVTLPPTFTATGTVVEFDVSATDSCGEVIVTADPPSGSVFPAGTTPVTVRAVDAQGNESSETFFVEVRYPFSGFFPPIQNAPVINSAKAGQAIPIKFSLGGYKGMNIFAPGFPISELYGSGSPASGVPIESPGNSSLSYTPGSDQYQIVWKTEKGWAKTKRLLVLKFVDGSTHTAVFDFK